MRIGIDARFLGTDTGIGRYIFELVKNLEETESESEFVVFLRKENYDFFNPKTKRIKKIIADITWYGFAEQIKMPALIAKENLNLMHFPHFNVPLFYRKPFVVTIHDLILLNYPSARATTLGPIKFFLKYIFYRVVIRYAIKKSKAIIVPSRFVKEDILKRFKVNAEKIKVVYEGAAFTRTVLVNSKDCPCSNYFLYVGNAYPHKNLGGLVKAFKIFDHSCCHSSVSLCHSHEAIAPYLRASERGGNPKRFKLILVGKEDYFKKRMKKEFTDENIIFKDFVGDDELSGLYRSAVAYIFPSFSEGFGLPGIEAMAHGTPALASDSSCLPEIYGDAAIYFDPKNINQMAEKMKEIAENKNLREELAEKGFEQIKKYSWKKMAEEILQIYKKL